MNEIDAAWIKQQMFNHGLTNTDLVEMLEIDKSSISLLLSGKKPLTKWHKAAFYYLFKSMM